MIADDHPLSLGVPLTTCPEIDTLISKSDLVIARDTRIPENKLDIVKSIPVKNYMRIKLEDLVINQDEEIDKLSNFLGFQIEKLPTRKEVVESWRQKDFESYINVTGRKPSNFNSNLYPFLDDYMRELNYPDWRNE